MNEDSESQKFHILLVEDNDADVYLLRKGLQKAGLGFELTVIDNGAEALDFVRNPSKYSKIPTPDLAVLDLNLPRNGGIEVLTALRQNAELAHVPIAIVTSSESPDERATAEQLGIKRFIVKPPDLEGLLQVGSILKDILMATKETRNSRGDSS